MHHTKKIQKKFYDKIRSGKKLWEIRKEDDCKYSVGDTISFEKSENPGTFLSGDYRIIYVLRDFPGIEPGYCIMSLQPIFKILNLGIGNRK